MNRISLSKSLAYSIFIWLSMDTVSGQVSQKIGGNPGTIDPKAVLELESTTKGFLLPRMTAAQMAAITNPTSGMIVFCTDCGVASDGELRISYNGVWQTYKGNVTGNVTGTAANVTGTVAVANGGTGATTATGALTNLGAAPIASPTFTGTVTSPIYASTPQALTYGSTINWNPTSGLNASVTLGGNATLSFTTLPAVGSYGTLIVTQDATGNRTLTLPTTANKVLGSASTTTIALSTAANAKDILNFYYDGTNCYWNIGQGYGTAAPAVITNLATGVSGTLPVANGGSGSTTLTGYVKGNGTAAMTANATIPVADVTGAAPIASPTFTGTPAAPTAAAGTNTTQVATTEFVTGAIATATIPDATTTAKGKVQLAGDLSGTAAAPVVAANAITTAKILDANVTDAKIATVSGSKVTGNITGSAANVTGTVAIANGGTGSTTQNFVDLTTNQTIAGTKAFSSNGSFKGQTIGSGNATGGSNLAVGSGALNAASTGHRNTAIGSSAMQNYSGTGFDNNTSVGYANLVGMTTGAGNTSVGAESMMSLTTGMYNTSIGNQSLIGTTGNSNVGVGQGAGGTITTGSNNTMIGTGANVSTNNLSNSTALGNGAVVDASNSIQLGNTSVTNVKTSGTLTSGAVTYPNAHGTTGQVLSTTGSGTLTWVAPSASSLTGTVAVANGGTGSTTATGALTNLGAAPIASPTFTGTVTAPIYASTPQALTYGSTINWNPTSGLNASVTLGGNATLSFTTLPAVGSYGTLIVTQDATGNRTLTLPTTANKVLGSASTTTIALSTAANAKDILNFYYDGTNCYWNIGQGYGTAAPAVITNLATGVSGTLPVANGGSGSTTLTGYVKGNGTAAMTANATIPVADVTGAAPIASPTFTGTPAAPTAAAGTNTTQVATTEFVTGAIATATIPDATTTAKGKVQLAGDLSGTAAAPVVAANAITTAKILDANVTDAKIATVSGSKVTGNITGSATNVTGTVAVTNGGTGSTTATGALTNLGAAPIASPTFTGTVTAPIYASTPQALTYGSTINWNPTSGLNASVTLGGNATLSFTTLPAVGSYGTLIVTQDATGNRTLTLPTTANKVLGSASTTTIALSTAANAKDILNFYYDGTNCYWNIGQGYGTAAPAVITNLATGVSGTLPVTNGGTGATTLTGLVKGNGTGAMTAAVAGTDYVAPSGSITGNAANVTGTVAIANGGTGQTTLEGVKGILGLTTTNVAIGASSGTTNQGSGAVGVGNGTGQTNQGSQSVAIGYVAGNNNQGANSVAIGSNAAQGGQGTQSVAIGIAANSSANNATALGGYATAPHTNATAIGFQAATTANNTIQLGADGVTVAGSTAITNVKTSGTLTAGAVTYPNTHGTTGQVLSTTGSGTLTWVAPSASSLSGTVAVANGGTGATTATGALTNLGAAPIASPTFTGSVTAPIYASTPQTLTYGSTINWNPTSGLNASVTLGGNGTLSFTTLPAVGSYGTLIVTQDATGNRTLTLPVTLSNKVLGSASSTTVTLSTLANAKDILNFYYDGTYCYWNIGQGYGTAAAAVVTNLATGVSGILPVANGGTGSTTQNFVDLTTNQTIAGSKTFSSNGSFKGQSIGVGNGTGSSNLAVGSGALNAASSGHRNTAIGSSAMQNYIGTGFDNNTSVGYNNLVAMTTGSGNTSVGAESMMAVTTGTANTSIGNQSLIGVTGNNNVGVGKGSGSGITTGSDNTLIGTNATSSLNSISNATAIGSGAVVATSNTMQLGNTSVSNVKTSGTLTAGTVTYPNTHNSSAGQILTVNASGTASWGAPSVGIPYTGATAAVNLGAYNLTVNELTIGKGNGSLSENTAFGKGVMANVTGNNNTSIGSQTMPGLQTGASNTAIGSAAGYSLTTGSNNIMMGYNANMSGNPSNSIAIGTNIDVNTSNTIQLGNTSSTTLKTYAKLNSGTVTYPNAHNSVAGQVLTTDAAGVASWASPSGVSGSGTLNYIPKFTSTSALGNSSVSDDGTGLRIGNPNGTAGIYTGLSSYDNTRLMVAGGREYESIKMTFPGDPYNNELSFNWYNSAWRMRTERSGGEITDLSFWKTTGAGVTTEKMRIDDGGYVKATGFKTQTGTSSQFLKANGTVDNSTYLSGTVSVANGGTGLTSTPANGQIDIGNGTGFTRATLTAGSGITITNTAGTITITAAVRPTTDQPTTVSAGQTSFTLSQTPVNAKVWMFINGVRTNNNAYSISGTTVTYTPASNNGYVIVAGDRVQFDYCY